MKSPGSAPAPQLPPPLPAHAATALRHSPLQTLPTSRFVQTCCSTFGP